ncbi:MetQ/NlpA family ABC transporter substrate-binding protein [Streptococcus sp. sy004]|uniref:MetQ/NlpA family ABC transporter substrate-binding protein n=1 Tax=Streptococcus sp. sy004 TaxID=2600149 RepID=UPI0011B5623B|nr:MetQ/NlpA family ABC transporter substrate-binding protein [Streptococcus sp. sy004]TWT11226.1 MetQ/NlpA family ABC transporter substrate-binding protein [Streptococcus sp. sy004]
MKLKKILGIASLALVSGFVLAACGQKSTSSDDAKTVTVGVMTKTESDDARWSKIQELLKADGITLEYKEFTDYSQPNKALANGEVDINAFQHYNFLDNWNEENKGDLVAIAETYISPIHLFSGTDSSGKAKYTELSQLPDNATIAVPNDATNESRVLYVLESAGLIKLNVSGKEFATVANITENKKNLQIKEVDASQTARSLTSVDAAFVNNSYAVPAGIDYSTSLLKEEVNDNSKQWINILAGQKDWESSAKADAIKKIIEAYHTDDVKKVIDETSDGVDVPVW